MSTRVCMDPSCDCRSTLDRCWACGNPTVEVERDPKPGARWWVCENAVCELVSERFYGPSTARCPECQQRGTDRGDINRRARAE